MTADAEFASGTRVLALIFTFPNPELFRPAGVIA
jgi:hypothetical protein